MNRYFLSRHFRVHQHAQGNAVPFCFQQLAAAETALCSPLLTTDHFHPQPLMSRTGREDRLHCLNRQRHRLIQIT